MGFYLRKSIRVGLFRFNLSRSGVGVSAGVKGLRIGSGPRGNYIHLGAGKLYYRKTLATAYQADEAEERYPRLDSLPLIPVHTTHAPLEDIESGTVFAMTESNSIELLEEINHKRKKWRIWPWVLVLGFFLSILSPWPGTTLLATLILVIVVRYYDQLRKTVVLFYELDKEIEPLYEALHHSINEMATSNKIWHIESQGRVYDKKYHAGANNLVNRKVTFVGTKEPSFLKTNIAVPTIGVGKQTLFFFPDRILILENKAVGAVSYRDLLLNVYDGAFIEDQGVPKDACFIGSTWKYVNKSGGPDKRFSYNPQIPIVRYSYIDFTSSSGLNERISLSRTDKAVFFEKAIKDLSVFLNHSLSI